MAVPEIIDGQIIRSVSQSDEHGSGYTSL